jgi:SAM-dependent MidA family methyltransferase
MHWWPGSRLSGFVTYIGLGDATFIQGVGHILKAGYVITIDYGANWDGLTTFGPYGKVRTYGPGSSIENRIHTGGPRRTTSPRM